MRRAGVPPAFEHVTRRHNLHCKSVGPSICKSGSLGILWTSAGLRLYVMPSPSSRVIESSNSWLGRRPNDLVTYVLEWSREGHRLLPTRVLTESRGRCAPHSGIARSIDTLHMMTPSKHCSSPITGEQAATQFEIKPTVHGLWSHPSAKLLNPKKSNTVCVPNDSFIDLTLSRSYLNRRHTLLQFDTRKSTQIGLNHLSGSNAAGTSSDSKMASNPKGESSRETTNGRDI